MTTGYELGVPVLGKILKRYKPNDNMKAKARLMLLAMARRANLDERQNAAIADQMAPMPRSRSAFATFCAVNGWESIQTPTAS